MVYSRLASGYRAGGPNATCIPFNVPCHFRPDKTLNYEVGVKGDFAERRVSVDASVYYIDWSDIQLTVCDPVVVACFNANASGAESKGIELSIESRPLPGLTLGAWVVRSQATLSEGLPPSGGAFGSTGDRLPYSSRISGSLSLEQGFPLGEKLEGSLGGVLSYVGDRRGPFSTDPARLELPAYAQANVHAGVRYADRSVNVFVNNLADRRGAIGGRFPLPLAYSYIQPRTIGASLAKSF